MRQEYDFSKGKRGAVVPAPSHKTRITIRIDTDILDWSRHQVNEAGGGTYQTMMTAARREHLQRRGKPLEEGKKSLAFNVYYRRQDRTLTEKEASEVHERIAQKIRDRGWDLR